MLSNYPKKVGEYSWIVEVKSDNGNKELYIELVPDSLHQMGWDPEETDEEVMVCCD